MWLPIVDRSPEEDVRLVDLGMKRSLDGACFPMIELSMRSRNFGVWIADAISEWGDKTNSPGHCQCSRPPSLSEVGCTMTATMKPRRRIGQMVSTSSSSPSRVARSWMREN